MKAFYLVTSDFAHFKAGQEIELSCPAPAGAQSHVKLIEKKAESESPPSQEETELRKQYEEVFGKKAGGNMKIETMRKKIDEALAE